MTKTRAIAYFLDDPAVPSFGRRVSDAERAQLAVVEQARASIVAGVRRPATRAAG